MRGKKCAEKRLVFFRNPGGDLGHEEKIAKETAEAQIGVDPAPEASQGLGVKDSRLPGPVWTAILLAAASTLPMAAQSLPGRDVQQQVQLTLDQFSEAKTDAQRGMAADFLQQLDRQTAIGAVIDRIVRSQNGEEATLYNGLIDKLKPEACPVLAKQLAQAADAEDKGKLVVALRHCGAAEAAGALTASLGDKRTVRFEAHGKNPRRVCDMAYDELFLKLRNDPKYGLDASPAMRGLIRESTPLAERDALVEKLSDKLAAQPAPVSAASPSPAPAKP